MLKGANQDKKELNDSELSLRSFHNLDDVEHEQHLLLKVLTEDTQKKYS